MKVHELLDMPKLAYRKGFKIKNGRVIWQDVHVNGDRKRIRISRILTHHTSYGDTYTETCIRYVKPHTEVEII